MSHINRKIRQALSMSEEGQTYAYGGGGLLLVVVVILLFLVLAR